MLQDLLFRRQFIISDSIFKLVDGWVITPLLHNLILSSHPDLQVESMFWSTSSLTFIGSIIDPRYPSLKMKDLLENIEKTNLSINDLIVQTYPFSGRWVIVYQDEKSTYTFTDPCGFRQVFYSSDGERVFCGSQPEIINAVNPLYLTTSREISDFVFSPEYARNELAWIGDKTIYQNCFHLLPNNYLDLGELKAHRFRPIDRLFNENKSSAIERAAMLLQGSIEAAVMRNRVQQAITAGWDSRMLLAASRKCSNNIKYFVDRKGQLSLNQPDISVPQKLSRKLGLDFKVVNSKEYLSGIFITLLSKNVTGARVLSKTRTIYSHFLSNDQVVKINGNGSEICRNFYDKHLSLSENEYRSSPGLARIVGYGGSAFVENELEAWKNKINDFDNNNVKLLDLLYWEQRLGNWGAQFPAEQDIAIEELSPFNNRLLIKTILSVPKEERCAPNYRFYRDLIRYMWPETLSVPINPRMVFFSPKIAKAVKSLFSR